MVTFRKVRIPAEKDEMIVTFGLTLSLPLSEGEADFMNDVDNGGIAFTVKRNQAMIEAMEEAIATIKQETANVIR